MPEHRLRPSPDQGRVAACRRRLVPLGVALVIVACAGPTATVPLSSSPRASPVGVVPITTSQPTSTVAATPTGEPAPDQWTPVPADALPAAMLQALRPPSGGGFSPANLFRIGGRFMLAVGGELWASSDGWSWTPVAELSDAAGAFIWDIAANEAGYVAIGSGQVGGTAVWTSPDGFSWTRVPDSPVLTAMAAVAITDGPAGLVAVGGSRPPGSGSADAILAALPAGAGHAAVWTSRDGRSWAKVDDQAVFAQGAMADVVAGGPGYVALGGDDCSTLCPQPGPLIWTSIDGQKWRFVDPRSMQPTGPGIGYALATGPGGVIEAGGFGDDGHGSSVSVAWRSVDGVHWTRAVIGLSGGGATGMTAVGDLGFIAIGQGIWGTADGRGWVSLSTIEPFGSESVSSIACEVDRCVATLIDMNSGTVDLLVGPARVTP